MCVFCCVVDNSLLHELTLLLYCPGKNRIQENVFLNFLVVGGLVSRSDWEHRLRESTIKYPWKWKSFLIFCLFFVKENQIHLLDIKIASTISYRTIFFDAFNLNKMIEHSKSSTFKISITLMQESFMNIFLLRVSHSWM